MTTAQKVIKYLAIAFAIFLIVTIISSILTGLFVLSGILGLKKHSESELPSGEMIATNFENGDITTLEIDLAFTNLTIKTGEFIKTDTDNSNITCKIENKNLQIKEKNQKWFSNHEKKELILYLPDGIKFEKVKIATGAGKIDIESLNTQKLTFELGAGETEIQNLKITKECKINGGAGKMSIFAGAINDLDLDMGIGEVNVTAILNGKSKIDAGVGNLNINLQGEKDSYKIQADKGLGSIKIDRKEITDGEIFGDGENYIEVDGGVGNIDIDFK